ncbi:MAG: hypothetical protein FWH41_04390 [Treponema sp.]|nr:hypothetical protein [Treponema sp.]
MNNDDFRKAFHNILNQALFFSEKARREGLLSLSEALNEHDEKIKQRNILYYGLSLATDGIDNGIIEKILSNLVNQEKDEYERLLKTIQREAVFSIMRGDNPRVMALLLNSHTGIPLNDPEMNSLLKF